ncbi:hypothetical protein [Rhabdochromatium marinum]|uniref:hypothetical protein n=1 Tax=Rhabdochromatium marinum TaxID=48729 RepID=UPI001904AA19|nr:hypothetical protein [Rhabdochromatium marinum]MBK1648973.1 hypothetical protein [Rhabdochromatium marinum]
MSKMEFIIKLVKLIKPEFYNKITRSVVISGLALIGTPFWEAIITAILEKELNLDLAPGGNAPWGYALVVLGLAYHFITNSLTKYIEYKQSNLRENNAIQHDTSIFKRSQDLWPENNQRYFFDELLTDHSYWTKNAIHPRKYIDYHISPENEFIKDEIQNAANEMIKQLDVLLDWMSVNFWVFPDKQKSGDKGLRLCMHPHWNIDRGGYGEPDSFAKYDEVTNKLSALTRSYRDSYKAYRKLVKNELFI